jgi:hypothetical protein
LAPPIDLEKRWLPTAFAIVVFLVAILLLVPSAEFLDSVRSSLDFIGHQMNVLIYLVIVAVVLGLYQPQLEWGEYIKKTRQLLMASIIVWLPIFCCFLYLDVTVAPFTAHFNIPSYPPQYPKLPKPPPSPESHFVRGRTHLSRKERFDSEASQLKKDLSGLDCIVNFGDPNTGETSDLAYEMASVLHGLCGGGNVSPISGYMCKTWQAGKVGIGGSEESLNGLAAKTIEAALSRSRIDYVTAPKGGLGPDELYVFVCP